MESLFIEKNLEIRYDPVHKILHCNWIGFQTKELILECGSIMLRLLKEKQCKKVLNDNTLVTGPWQEAADWTSMVWFPSMIEAGLQQFAWIFSPNIFAELSAIKAMPASDVVKSFNNRDEALEWLVQQESSNGMS
jgi:hypothetical protein